MDGANWRDGKSAPSGVSKTPQSAVAASCGIAFMAKASAPGRAKTRLVPPLSFDEAAAEGRQAIEASRRALPRCYSPRYTGFRFSLNAFRPST